MEIERKTIFLYPDLNNASREELISMTSLITSINQIVVLSNRQIAQILKEGNFSFIRCMPTVLMRCVDSNIGEQSNYNDVRICIAKFNNTDYTSNYTNIVNDFQHGDSNISHLVALHIVTKTQKTKFMKDHQGNFDAIIEVNLENLQNLLVSIMLDISLYHYFTLSTDIRKRKEFNTAKYRYVVNTDFNAAQALYGGNLSKNDPIYLPITLRFIKELSRREAKDSRAESILNMQKWYCVFLAESLGIKVQRNDVGSIINPYEFKGGENYKVVEDFVRNHANYERKYIIIVPDTSTESSKAFMVEYDSDNMPRPWGNELRDFSSPYQIFCVNGKEVK